jgi:predicted DNA-binding protein with PD1-like motif
LQIASLCDLERKPMLSVSAVPRRLVAVRLNPGDDILLALREAVRRDGIRGGIILSGVGSISQYHVHVVQTTNMPPGDTFFRGEGPFDILTLSGAIIDGRVHAHITFSNTERAMGGHLEEGTRVLTFSVVTIADTPDTTFADWDRVGAL